MTVEDAFQEVARALGPEWRLAGVESWLVPGTSVGAPTEQRVRVALERAGEYRVYYEGTGASMDGALSIALGAALGILT
jgi:hypothetical protein